MSLVNDMLRDLDRRRQLPVQAHRIGRVIDLTDDEPRSRAAQLALLALASLAIGLAAGYFLMQKPDNTAPELDFAAPDSVPVQAAPTVLPEPAQIPERRSLEIAEVVQTNDDFTLRLRGNQRLDYSITDRNDNGMTLKFDRLDAYDDHDESISGLSVIQMPDYTLFELELPADADMKLYEADAGPGFELVLSARYRRPLSAQVEETPGVDRQDHGRPADALEPQVAEPLLTDQLAQPMSLAGNESGLSEAATPSVMGLHAAPPAATGTQRRTLEPLRVTRGFTLEQQDRNASQSAVALVQNGRLLEAYDQLLGFLARNPEAHNTRETLGTILLAQGEQAQAAMVVDEGLRLAPNYAPYKKIKARLLMQEGRPGEALHLLEPVAPTLLEDKEYHELLATLYQQAGEHGKAISTYQQLLRTNSAEGRWWTGLGISLEAQGDTQKAIASYQAALQQGNLDPGVRQYSQGRIRTLSVQ